MFSFLIKDLGHYTATDSPASLAHRKVESDFDGDGKDHIACHSCIVSRHDHLCALGKSELVVCSREGIVFGSVTGR